MHLSCIIVKYRVLNISYVWKDGKTVEKIYNAVVKEINGLPYLDSFKDIGTLVENENLMSIITYDESSFD